MIHLKKSKDYELRSINLAFKANWVQWSLSFIKNYSIVQYNKSKWIITIASILAQVLSVFITRQIKNNYKKNILNHSIIC